MRIDKDLVATTPVLGSLADAVVRLRDPQARRRSSREAAVQWTDGMLYPLLHRLERLGSSRHRGARPNRRTAPASATPIAAGRPSSARPSGTSSRTRSTRSGARRRTGCRPRRASRRGGPDGRHDRPGTGASPARTPRSRPRSTSGAATPPPRGHLRAGIVDEMEDHLRERGRGPARDRARRRQEGVPRRREAHGHARRPVARVAAQEHSERLWKQRVLVGEQPTGRTRSWREGDSRSCSRSPSRWASRSRSRPCSSLGDGRPQRRAPAAFLTASLAWKRQVTARVVGALVVPFVALGLVATCTRSSPRTRPSSSRRSPPPGVRHGPSSGSRTSAGGGARTHNAWRLVRFTGEPRVLHARAGGGVLLRDSLAGIDLEPYLDSWILTLCVPAALIVAAWLVEAEREHRAC